MSTQAKKTNGSFSPTTLSLHSTPVNTLLSGTSAEEKNSPVVLTDIYTIALKSPQIKAKQQNYDASQESPVSGPSDGLTFSGYTGLPENKPTILLSSEFKPLYLDDSNTRATVGDHLSIKENSKILNAKTAINILLQNPYAVSEAQNNKKSLGEFVVTETDLVKGLMRAIYNAHSSLSIKTFSSPQSKDPKYVPMFNTFQEILSNEGYASGIKDFTSTKVWHQSLVALKKSFLAYPVNLVPQYMMKSDADPFIMSDLQASDESLKRLWFDPTFPVLSIDLISKTGDNYSQAEIDSWVNNLYFLESNRYVDLSKVNYADSQGGSFYGLPKYTSDVMKQYESFGKDIGILANILLREARYSIYLDDANNAKIIQERYGYSVRTDTDNLQLWDYIIGTIPSSIFDIDQNPVGTGRTLVRTAQQDIVKDQNSSYHVLTFESNSLNDPRVTPGSSYYVDSVLSTSDGVNFDTTNLKSIISNTETGYKSTNTLFGLLGYSRSRSFADSQQNSTLVEQYKKYENVPDSLSFDSMVKKLSSVSKIYQDALVIGEDGMISQILDPAALSSLSDQDKIGIRLAAIICKCAVSPIFSHVDVAKRLKPELFLWIMNAIIQRVHSAKNEKFISDIKYAIARDVSSIEFHSSEGLGPIIELELARAEERYFDITSRTVAEKDVESNRKMSPEDVTRYIFDSDPDQGLWKDISDILLEVYKGIGHAYSSDVYQDKDPTDATTIYSRIPKIIYLYNYFELILKIVAAQCPENLAGFYAVAGPPKSGKSKIYYGLISETSPKEVLNDQFETVDQFGIVTKKVKKLSNASDFLSLSDKAVTSQITLFREYLKSLNTQMNAYLEYVTQNYSNYLSKVKTVYDSDQQLQSQQKIALLNQSLTNEQMKLSQYISSEIKDRVYQLDSMSKLTSTVWFNSFPSGFMDFVTMNDIDMVSFSMLSPFFRTSSFLPKQGNNKRIMSVGIPDRLIRSLNDSSNVSNDVLGFMKKGLVRLKVYKLDALHPDIVYLPRSFVFDMNRFPTRSLNNWYYTSFALSDRNILNIPCKVFSATDMSFQTFSGFDGSFPSSLYGDILTENQKSEIYSNHSLSFLLEEYIRWFTDCRIDESRFYNYASLSPDTDLTDSQYVKFVNFIKSVSSVPETAQLTSQIQGNGNDVFASFTDMVTGKVYTIPVNKTSRSSQTMQTASSTNKQIASQKTYVLSLDKTMKTFFENETMFEDNSESLRRIVYPKKFSRVFNIAVDPDDFYVDKRFTSPQTLDKFSAAGIIVGDGSLSDPYRHRETSISDVSYDEYFVTIEPYELGATV